LRAADILQNYQDSENISRAIALFEEAIELDPEYTPAYAALGEASWRMYNETRGTDWVDKARMNSRIAMASSRDHPDVFITVGMIQRGTGEYEAAIESYNRALNLDPLHYEAHIGLAEAYERIGKTIEAEDNPETCPPPEAFLLGRIQ
jgi:tetratricopeptide (TPR) repeat protein